MARTKFVPKKEPRAFLPRRERRDMARKQEIKKTSEKRRREKGSYFDDEAEEDRKKPARRLAKKAEESESRYTSESDDDDETDEDDEDDEDEDGDEDDEAREDLDNNEIVVRLQTVEHEVESTLSQVGKLQEDVKFLTKWVKKHDRVLAAGANRLATRPEKRKSKRSPENKKGRSKVREKFNVQNLVSSSDTEEDERDTKRSKREDGTRKGDGKPTIPYKGVIVFESHGDKNIRDAHLRETADCVGFDFTKTTSNQEPDKLVKYFCVAGKIASHDDAKNTLTNHFKNRRLDLSMGR